MATTITKKNAATSCLQLDPAAQTSRQLSTASAAPGIECRAPKDRCWIPGAGGPVEYGFGPENMKKIGKKKQTSHTPVAEKI